MRREIIPLHRFLFAARTPPSVAAQIERESLRRGNSGRPVRADLYHITLAMLDDYSVVPTGLPERLIEAGTSIVAEPFPLLLNRIVGSHRSVALRPNHAAGPLKQLRNAIVEAMDVRGIKERDGYRFSPHLTLRYRDGQPSSEMIGGFGWVVDEFVLIDSHVGHTHHEVLGRWKLSGLAGAQYQLL